MNLTDEQELRVLDMAAKDLADRVWNKIKDGAEEIALFSPSRAAGILDLSTPQFNKVAREAVDLGGKNTRFSLGMLKRLIADRTVRRAKKGGRP